MALVCRRLLNGLLLKYSQVGREKLAVDLRSLSVACSRSRLRIWELLRPRQSDASRIRPGCKRRTPIRGKARSPGQARRSNKGAKLKKCRSDGGLGHESDAQ
jgi:hypothetical protein